MFSSARSPKLSSRGSAAAAALLWCPATPPPRTGGSHGPSRSAGLGAAGGGGLHAGWRSRQAATRACDERVRIAQSICLQAAWQRAAGPRICEGPCTQQGPVAAGRTKMQDRWAHRPSKGLRQPLRPAGAALRAVGGWRAPPPCSRAKAFAGAKTVRTRSRSPQGACATASAQVGGGARRWGPSPKGPAARRAPFGRQTRGLRQLGIPGSWPPTLVPRSLIPSQLP